MRPALPELQKYLNIFIQVNKYNFNFKCTCYSLVKTIIMIRKLVVVILIVLFPQIILGQTTTYIIKKASFSSDKYDEFSPVFYKNGIVFSSNRNVGLSSIQLLRIRGSLKYIMLILPEKRAGKMQSCFQKT